MKINGNLQFLGLGQIQNLRVENLATDPVSPVLGQIWYNTTTEVYMGFDGTAVFPFATGGNATAIQAELDAVEAAVGLNTDGTFAAFVGTNYLGSATTFAGAATLLDTAIKANATAIATEVTAREAAITQEVTDRNSAITTAVAAETTRATAAEGVIAGDLAQEVTDRQAADAAEVTARDAAIAAAVSAANGDLQANIDAEEAARIAADAAEVTARNSAITAAVGAEATDRESADTALQANIDLKVSKSGDTMTGQLAMGSNRIIGLGAPTDAADATTKNYVDSLVNGLSWLPPVALALADHTTATGVVVGDRVADLTDGKIYTVTSVGPVAFGPGVALVDGQAFFSKADETGYVYSGTTTVQFTGSGQITAGIGLSKTGNQIDVNLGAGIAQLPTDEVGVDVLGTGGLFLTVDGTTSSTDTASQLAIKLDGSTITRGANGIKVSDATIASITAASDAIAAEVTRATTAEGVLATNLAAEVTRAEGVEAQLQTDLSAEVTRATTAEGTLTTNLAAEVTRATTAEGVNASAITDEVTRATAAEGVLTTAVTNEVARAEGVEADLQTQIDGIAERQNAGYFLYTASSAALSHTVTHSMGSQYANVTVVDSDDQVVIPQSIKFDTVNQLTVTFNTAITCKVVVSGLKV